MSKDHELDVHLLLNEFATGGRVPVIPAALANLRKHRASIFAVVQDFSQVVGAYGREDATSLRSNAFAKMYFGGGSPESTREISDVLGKYTYEKEGKKDVLLSLLRTKVRLLKPNRAILILRTLSTYSCPNVSCIQIVSFQAVFENSSSDTYRGLSRDCSYPAFLIIMPAPDDAFPTLREFLD